MQAYKEYLFVPEYVALVEKLDFRDFQAFLFAKSIASLQKNGLNIDCYSFQINVDLLIPEVDHPRACSLKDILERQSNLDLWLLTDGYSLLDRITGKLNRKVLEAGNWINRKLITPVPVDDWGDSERTIERSGIGLWQADSFIEGHVRPSIQESTPPLDGIPNELLESRRSLTSSTPPESSELLLENLRQHLNKQEFFLLSACSVFPDLPCELPIRLSQRLKADGQLISSEVNLFKLARLPWFRLGRMPNWVRKELILLLSSEQEKQVRRVLFDWLSEHRQERGAGSNLEIFRLSLIHI